MAVFARSADARRAAAEILRGRDPLEYAETLIRLLGEPIRFEVGHVGGPGSPGRLLIEGKVANLLRVYAAPPVLRPGDRPGLDAEGRPVIFRAVEPSLGVVELGAMAMGEPPRPFSHLTAVSTEEFRAAIPIMADSLSTRPLMPTTAFFLRFGDRAAVPLGQLAAEADRSRAATERQLRADVRLIEDHNVALRIANDRVAGVLNDATGQSLPPDRRAWTGWWVDRIGYSGSQPDWTARASVVEDVAIAYRTPDFPEGSTREILDYGRRSCFGAGTPVRTLAGPRAIETLRVGDRVLTQDTAGGALGYKAITAVHRNPPAATFRIAVGGGPIVSSHFHRFWVAGRGWTMARELKAGDPIRTLGGVAPIESIEADAIQPVFNLDVADDADFFAGDAAALVHDNTLPDPRQRPFDAPGGR